MLQRKGGGLQEGTACAEGGRAEVGLFPQASGPVWVPRRGRGEPCLQEAWPWTLAVQDAGRSVPDEAIFSQPQFPV